MSRIEEFLPIKMGETTLSVESSLETPMQGGQFPPHLQGGIGGGGGGFASLATLSCVLISGTSC